MTASNQRDEDVPGISDAAVPCLEIALEKQFLSTTKTGRDVASYVSTGFRLAVEISVPGGVTILFGRSGAGKSTLLDSIAGLVQCKGRVALHQSAGTEVWFDSENDSDVPPAKRGLGYVFQNLALFPHLTIAQNVEFGIARLQRAERRHHSQIILESFHIGALAARFPSEISGGERQRAALARTLVTEPRALLLDEPLSALDTASRAKIVQDLLTWNQIRRIPILYVTHSKTEALRLGERAIVLEAGKVVAQGEAKAALRNYETE